MGKKKYGSDSGGSGDSGSEDEGYKYKYKEHKDKDKHKEKDKDKKDKDKDKKSKEDKHGKEDKYGKDHDKHDKHDSYGQYGAPGVGGSWGGHGIVPPQFPLHAPVPLPQFGGHSSDQIKAHQPSHDYPGPHGPPPGSPYGQVPGPPPPQAAAPPHGAGVPPPSGYRVPLATNAPFPAPQQTGQPIARDLDGSPLYFGSALMNGTVQPCKIAPALNPPCRVPYAGTELEHNGRYDLLPFDPNTMDLVPTSWGRLPPGKRPVEGGYEDNGTKLYHAVATIQGVRVPGKTGEHLGGANVPFGGGEVSVENYEILCWK